MLNKLISILFLTSIIGSMQVLAESKYLSLQEAISIAKKQSPEIATARASWKAAEAKFPQTISLDDPRLGLEYDQIPNGSGNLEAGMKMYTFEQMIPFPGKIYAERQMAQRESDLFEARYFARVLEVLSQVKSAYYDLFFADRSIETMTETTNFLGGLKNVAESKYATGKTAQSDALQANIEYLLIQNELLTLKQEREVKEAKLKALLADNQAATLATESELSFPPTIESETVLEQYALDHRPDLLAMKAEIESKDSAHLKSKMEFFPDIDLGVKKRVEDGWDAMISVSVPLYFWKQSYGVASAGLEREEAEAAYHNMQYMTIWELKEAYVMSGSLKRTIDLYAENILPQSSQALKAGLSAYQTGKTDFQSLLQIEKMYKETKLKFYENQVDYGKALAELVKIAGKELN